MFRFLRSQLAIMLVLSTIASLIAADVQAQATGTVRGRVVAANSQQPLAGVQVSIPGTGRGTLTGNAGEFLIVGVPVGPQTVRAQMLGYTTQEGEVTVSEGQASRLDFELASAAIALDEIVVTGAGVATQKKALGQSVASVNSDEFETAPITNMTDALTGRVAGLVAGAAGETGQGAPIRLRGTVSLSQRNGPLIYVDGVRVDNRMNEFASIATSPLNNINPESIERVEVLKGAAAATLYGTEASAGVIQIFTKRGVEGEPQFEFSTTQQLIQMPDRIPENAVFDSESGQILRNHPSDDYVDLGHHQAYNLSVRGGSSEAKYFASGSWREEVGILPTNGLENFNFDVGLDVTPMEKLQAQFNLNVIKSEIQAPYPSWGLLGEFTLADPRRVDEQRPYGELFYTVPGAIAYNNTQAADRYTVSGTARYQWLENLTSQATLGYNNTNEQSIIFIEYGRGLRDPFGRRQVADYQSSNVTLDLSTAWEQAISSSLLSTLTVGGQSFWETFSNNQAGVQDYPAPGLKTLRGGASVYLVDEYFEQVINAGVFAQEQLAINDRVFLTAGVRVDGNSAFGDDFGFQTYPKAGISWAISEEPFWSLGFFDQVRLRAAYGTSGLQPGAYDALRTWRAYAPLDNVPALRPFAVGNTALQPERSTEIEFGGDVAFFNNRVGLEATYFRQRTDDAILERELPPSSGFLQPQFVNIGELRSQGIEAVLDVTAVEKEELRVDLGATFSYTDQEVTDLGGITGFKTSNDTRRWNWILEGYQPGAVVAPVLDPANPFTTTVPIAELTSLSQIVGNTIKNSAGGDSLIFIGNQLPTTTGTFSTTFDFPRLNLNFRTLFRGESGFVMLDQTNLIRTQVGLTEETAQMIQELNNPATTTERRGQIAARYAEIHPQVHSNWVQDGSNIRFLEAALTYRLPQALSSRIGLENTAVTVAGRNLYLWSEYDGIADPGTSNSPTSDFNLNVDYFQAPIPRRFELSVRTGF
jgi:TonB-dependent SusC/RagA subfamily outer membrane receptor